ncbi:MAG: VWA domain-containing protein [Anaerolineae bacterium]|nr:VWA domain-containing protein [Anaerolineae bacterium]
MAVSRPLFLLLLPLLAAFAYLGWPRGQYGRRRAWAALALRALIVALVVFSLAGTQSIHGSDELAVVFLVDASDSIPPAEQERALAFVEQALSDMAPDDRAALVLFGADALVERPMSSNPQLATVASIPQTHQSDLEEAVRLGLALFPGGAARRMVLLSDGRPTTGEVDSAIRLAHAQGVQVDVVNLLGQADTATTGEAWVADVDLPTRLHQDESFNLSVEVESTAQMEAALTILSGDRVVAQEAVHLGPGSNRFAVTLASGAPGFATYRAILAPATDVYPQNNTLSAFALVEGPPRVLVVASDPAESQYVEAALAAAGLDIDHSSAGAMPSDPAALAEYAAVVLADTPAQAISPRAMAALQSFVRDLGGGLVATGGPHAYGVGGWYETPLEETLPVEMTIEDPERFPPMAIVVIIDKSGSMTVTENGVQKIRLAGEAAARVAELINDQDEITVIAFDDRPADVIGPLPGTQRDEVIDQVIRLQAGGGGIYVRESLEAALGILADSPHAVRHIILLSDGSDSEHQEGVAAMVEEQIAGQNITLSVVAIGAGQDLSFLEEIAGLGNGRYYFTDQAATLPVIFAQEAQLAMRSYVVEEPFYPHQTASSPMLDGITSVPQLAGYVATTPKPAAQVVLATHQEDPLLAAWQYGLGRSVAWTSDATGRWAQRWVEWDDFTRFWSQVVRWTVAQQSDVPVEVDVTLDGETATIQVDALDNAGTFINEMVVSASLVGPEGGGTLVDLAQTAPGRYEGAFVPEGEGAYLLRLTGAAGEESVGLTTGWVMGYSPEYAALAADPTAMAYLAELGGGRVLETPAQAFEHTLRGEGTARDLWPVLLAVATALLPFDVAVRRLAVGRQDLVRAWAWVTARLPRKRPRPAVAPTSPGVSRLFEAKERAEQTRRAEPAAGAARPVSPPAPTPPPKPRAADTPAPPVPAKEGGTLASQLLKRKQDRDNE